MKVKGWFNRGKYSSAWFMVLAWTVSAWPVRAQETTKGGLASLRETVERILAIPEEKLDLATAVLTLSHQHDPSAEVETYRQQIGDMAAKLKPRLAEQTEPAGLVRILNAYLFDELRFQAVPEEEAIPEDRLLHTVLARKRGVCLSLSLIYLSLGQALNLPLHGVKLPEHFFVRYDDGRMRINIEPTDQGRSYPDEWYRTRFGLRKGREGPPFYLQNLTKREVLACFLTDLADELYYLGQAEAAMEYLSVALRIVPGDADAHNDLGVMLYRRGEAEEAVSHFQTALGLNPGLAKAAYNLGLILYHDQGAVEEGVAHLRTALRIDPDYADAHVDLGVMLRDQGQLDAALAEYRAGLRLNPNHAEGHLRLALALHDLGRVEEAIPEYQAALRIDSDYAEAHKNLAAAYFQRKDYASAWKHLHRASELGSHLHAGFLAALRAAAPEPE